MIAEDYNRLQMRLCGESNAILRDIGLRPSEAYGQMLREPEMLMRWWDGAFDRSSADREAIDLAARAFAAGSTLPELTIAQRARLALRLRIGSRLVRAISSRHYVQPKGWFQNKLRRLSEKALVEWILLDGWHFCAEVLDESLIWSDEVAHPIAPSIRRSPPASSAQDDASGSE